MRKKIYEYILKNPNTTHHICANALGITEFDTLKYINELSKDGLLRLNTIPLGNSINPDCSCFYTVCKPYQD